MDIEAPLYWFACAVLGGAWLTCMLCVLRGSMTSGKRVGR